MEKKKILYIMGVDWEWIYQRPQIFAEKLAMDYAVTVIFPRSILSRRHDKPSKLGMEFRILWTLPGQEKCKVIEKISNWLNRKLFRKLEEYSYIYIGFPLYTRYIRGKYRGKIIYDCMDDHEAMYWDPKRVYKITEQEKWLIQKSSLLIVSSKKLAQKTDALAGCAKSILVRNGANSGELCRVKQPCVKESYNIYYIGTISKWFDYDLLTGSIDQVKGIIYHLVGPAAERIEYKGILYKGIIPHNQLEETIKDCDCLIMPFRLNEIVLSVDPVKLYEYITFGKCIVSVYYPEVEPFSDFVYFYRKPEEYIELLRVLKRKGFPPKYSKEQQKSFLFENTWERRYELLKRKMEEVSE